MITVDQLIKNLQKGQSSVRSSLIIAAMEQHYLSIKDKIKIAFAEHNNDGTTIYFKVPATDENISYDVVFTISTKNQITLKDVITLYSNSPFFIFNLAYVFNQQNGLMLKNKIPHKALTEKPKVRNPFEVTGFDKHIYSCLRLIWGIKLSEIVDQFKDKDKNKPPHISSFEEKVEEKRLLKERNKLHKK